VTVQTDNNYTEQEQGFSWTTIVEQSGSTGATRGMPEDAGGSTSDDANAPDFQQGSCGRRI
jgi:hypothetical protein